MKQIKSVEVLYHGQLVGTLSEYREKLSAFQYSSSWLSEGFSISPFSLPLQDKVFFSSLEPFNGLFGVFEDCLPDGWGMLLTDRLLRSKGIMPESVGNITRLSLLGSNAKGALEFRPCQFSAEDSGSNLDFDVLYEQCTKLLESDKDLKDYDKLFSLAGSSGGARPKANITIDGKPWIIKFPSSSDSPDIGKQEYQYTKIAQSCQIRASECQLLPSKKTPGFFATKRFDRSDDSRRIHMVSAGGLLEVSHRFPVLDYSHLLKLTNILTKDERETENMFRLMCFNEVMHNRDDHSKNFSFLYDEKKGKWIMSPAYDLTYSSSVNGEHATTINGNGKDIMDEDILKVGTDCTLDANWCKKTLEAIRQQGLSCCAF